MSCLNASVSRIGESITASVVTNNGINVAVERYGCGVSAIARVLNKAVEATASLCSKIIMPIVTRIGDPMVVTCGMVCSINDEAFLLVSPSEVMWITDDEGVIFNVVSNTDWEIV